MLKVEELAVFVDGKEVVKEVSAEFDGVNILMGPNGSGKSSFAFAIAGHPKYKTRGRIFLGEKEISKLKPEERARLGVFLAFQNPPEIEGLLMKRFANMLSEKHKEEAKNVGVENFLERSLNYKFSGGEKKRSELFQLLLLKPKFAILDEIDSGLDVEGIKKSLEVIENMRTTSFLVITHNPEAAEMMKADRVFVMLDGKIVESGGSEIIKRIKEEGYAWLR